MRVLVLAFLFTVPFEMMAHLPRIPAGDRITVVLPEVSQAFYAVLNGQPHTYYIDEADSFDFYVQVLIPDLPGQRADFYIKVMRVQEGGEAASVYERDTKLFPWLKYYEPYGGDYYLKGPELRFKAAPGSYFVIISNEGNTGKYALAVGEKESWPADEIWHTLKILPALKKDFFGKSPCTAYFNRVGIILALFILIAGTSAFLFFRLVKRKFE